MRSSSDLRRELARRRQDQRAGRAARPVHQLVQDRQQKRGGLAAAGHRTRQQIPALERRGNRFCLDGCRSGEAEVLETPQEFGVKLEMAKRQEFLWASGHYGIARAATTAEAVVDAEFSG